MPQRLRLAALLVVATACGGAAKPTSNTSPPPPGQATAGIALPKEISALPPKSGAATAFRALAARAVAPAGSDYAGAVGVKFVDERALAQFDIFNTIFGALADTHYADPANVNAGPYRALVRWEQPKDESQSGRQLIPWTVDSRMVKEGGADVNVIHVWMADPSPQGTGSEIAVEFRISAAPTQRADGTYADYGVWSIVAQSNETPPMSFSASASRDASGASIVKVHDTEGSGGAEVKGILQRADATGFGKVSYPDWSKCSSQDCRPPPTEASYAYDAASVVIAKGAAAPVHESRTRFVDIVSRYGLYDATTFEDVARAHVFGFGVEASSAGGPQYGYYGAWQGRHQLWTNGQQSMPAGVTVLRSDRDRSPGAAPVAYTTSPPFTGVLVKRTPVDSTLAQLQDVILQGFESRQLALTRTPAGWDSCYDPQWTMGALTCSSSGAFSDFQSLVSDPNGRRQVWIGAPSQPGSPPVNLVCDGQGQFFYPGSSPGSPGAPYTPSVGDRLFVNLGGPIYLVYTAGGWMQKSVAQWLQDAPLPLFGPTDSPFTFQPDREYYLNDRGANYIVKTADNVAFSVKIERQSAANPRNAGTFVPAGTVFTPQWAAAGAGTPTSYEFVTDPASPSYLKLVYRTVSASDAAGGASVGGVVTTGQWGLVASGSGDQFNWDYPQPGQGWGVQQFLIDGSGQFVILDEPIRFAPVQLASVGGATKTYALQFDGSWVSGLPEVWNDLRAAGYQMTAAIADAVVVIPDGFEVVDALPDPVSGAPRHYVFKALRTSEFLMPLPAAPDGLTLDAASALDLASVPALADPGIGPRPAASLKYVEGKPVP